MRFKLVQAAVVFDHIVGAPPFFCQAHLRVDMLLRLGSVQPVTLLQTLKLGVDIASDQDDRTKPFVQVAFKKQRDFIDDDVKAGGGMFANSLLGEGAHPRMYNRLDFAARGGIIEDNRSQLLPVEALVRLQNLCAEGSGDFLPRFAARLDHLAGQCIRIDDRRTEAFKDFGDSAFS